MEGIDKSLPTFESIGLSGKKKPLEKQQRLGQEDFMKLMMAQMKHQDPLKPMANGEFISQMAQFSSVEGLKEIKDSFNKLANALQSSQALQASSMVGRSVLIKGQLSELVANGQLRGAVDVSEDTSKLTVKIMNKAGQLVKTLDLGEQKQGTAQFKWDGVIKKADPAVPGSKDEIAPPGLYKVVAEIEKDGKAQAANTFVVDKVDSVSLSKGEQGVTLNLNHTGATSLANVREII
jgi:flagellar basal-body rod modification protein FlgD